MSRTLGNAVLSTKSFEQLVTMAIPRLSAPHPQPFSPEYRGEGSKKLFCHLSLVISYPPEVYSPPRPGTPGRGGWGVGG